MTPSAFSSRHVAILEALALYRFLTTPLAVRLGLGDRWRVGEALKDLERAKYVNVAKQSKQFGLPYVYTLAPKGASQLEAWSAETGEERTVTVRKSPVRLGEHLNQRLCTVAVLISLRAWAGRSGATVRWTRAEYDPNPNGTLEPATTVVSDGVKYTPDAIASIEMASGEPFLFAVEMETGGKDDRIDNFRNHIEERTDVFSYDILDNALEWPQENRAARCLFVFETQNLLGKAQKLVGGQTGRVWRKMLFNSLENVERNFAAGWWMTDRTTGGPFR